MAAGSISPPRAAGDVTSPTAEERLSSGPHIRCPFPTVTAAFAHHAGLFPDVLAAVDLSGPTRREVSYGDLQKRAISLAHRLRKLGIGPGDRVPLVVKRGTEMLVGLLAILACGAQYVPLDGGVVPDSTLKRVLDQCAARVVLCLASTEYRVRGINENVTTIPIPPKGADGDIGREPVDLATPASGCYIIFTSGKSFSTHCQGKIPAQMG